MDYFTASETEWTDWKWQQRNSIRDVRELSDYFPQINNDFFEEMHSQSQRFRFQVTPYILSQIPRDLSQEELQENPWYLQFFPLGEVYVEGHDSYDGTDNWERTEEFPTSNIQHKYTNRALVRFRNCLAYCNFCFEALGTLEKEPEDHKRFHWRDWQKSLDYIANHPDVEEVVLSGGEPLLLSDSKLESALKDLSKLEDGEGKKKVRFMRIATQSLTHNPYRATDSLVEIFRKYKINEIGFDVAHPSEITPEFEEAVYRIREGMGKHSPILVTHTPLVKNLNADSNTLWEMFSRLYELSIKPYYLIHSFPHTPFADQQRVSVKDGVRLMKKLKRHKTNIALLEYIIAHNEGKITVPFELDGTPEFIYTKDKKGNPIVRFLNWKNKWVEYPDIEDVLS